MNLTERAAYLKGLADGVELDANTKEGKLISALIELVSDMADEIAEMDERIDTAFAYCEEEGTFAAENYRDSISKKKKQERLDRLMEVQQRISTRLNEAKTGNVYRTIIDRVEGDYYIGRTEFDSPDVDTEVLINVNEGELKIGEFYNARITDATEFDLMGTVEK